MRDEVMPEYPDAIHVVCAADAAYGAWAGIALAAVIRANPGVPLSLHLFSDGVRRRDLAKLRAVCRRHRVRFRAYEVGAALEQHARFLQGTHHLSRTAYARILVDEFLPADVRRVIYLDCDVVCTAPISELWTLGAALPLLGAVPAPGDSAERIRTLELPPGATYFNSGVLLINLDAWRARRIGAELLAFVARNPGKILWLDQDAINAVLSPEISPLPARWNVQLASLSPAQAVLQVAGAAFLHFNGQHKPWHFGYRGPAADVFERVKVASPWRWRLPEFRFVYRLTKSVRKRRARSARAA